MLCNEARRKFEQQKAACMNSSTLSPGPCFPTAVQSAWLAYRPYRFLEWCRDRFGEAFTIKTPLGRTPIFASPRYVKEIFPLDGQELAGGRGPSSAF